MDPRADSLRSPARGTVERGRGFGKGRRLRLASDFNRVFKQGRRLSLQELTLVVRQRPGRPGQVPGARLGLSVSRKVGGAVERNRFKRRMREWFRVNADRLPDGFEIVAIPRKEAANWSLLELKSRVESLLERAKSLKPVV